MFRNISTEGQKAASPSGRGVASAGLDGQESSWIGLLSVLSRPALSFLQKYVTGRARNPVLSERGTGWIGADLKTSLVDEEREILSSLDDMVPAPHLTYLRCQQDFGAEARLEPSPGSSVPWLTTDSLRELGIQSAEEVNLNRTGPFPVRTLLSHVLWSSSQEINPTGGKNWRSGGKTRTWWSSLWGGEDSSQSGLLSDLSWAEGDTLTGPLCPDPKQAETKAVFVQSSDPKWTLAENTGPTDHKDQLAHNGGLHTVQNTEGSTPDRRLSISGHLSSSGAAACDEVALLTPDQDNGYSSLEEEQVQMSHLSAVKASGEESETTVQTEMVEDSEGAGSSSGREEEASEEDPSAAELPTPQCQNKAIAFIMGCPCSDDDSSQSDGSSEEEEEDDDDGFDSEGSSDLSDSTDEDDEDSDSDSASESESERLWNSLCQSLDPYNPRNFTARLQTGSSPPRTIPTSSSPPSSAQSTPASSPQPAASSPPCDVWDDSTSASEADEAESLRLWSSFSSSDPYSPFNFQAPLRTQGPAEAAPRSKSRSKKASQTPSQSPPHRAAPPPEYRKEEAEERLDSGFSEPCSSSRQSCAPAKKVRFCEDVEEFFASCGEEEEDRRGPWEELARDRCRFLRRCLEVEQNISYCLQPRHRDLVYSRLALHVQDDPCPGDALTVKTAC